MVAGKQHYDSVCEQAEAELLESAPRPRSAHDRGGGTSGRARDLIEAKLRMRHGEDDAGIEERRRAVLEAARRHRDGHLNVGGEAYNDAVHYEAVADGAGSGRSLESRKRALEREQERAFDDVDEDGEPLYVERLPLLLSAAAAAPAPARCSRCSHPARLLASTHHPSRLFSQVRGQPVGGRPPAGALRTDRPGPGRRQLARCDDGH